MKTAALKQTLLAFLVFIIGMLLCRAWYSSGWGYIFLLWNLFLAWIPFQLSIYFPKAKASFSFKNIMLPITWLLFFPNSLYIITDLIHLEFKTDVPLWYDAILILTSALLGLMMAFASLYKAEIFFRLQFNNIKAGILVVASLFLGSFGVYLGRFLRWNSWDVVTSPLRLSSEILVRVIFPLDHCHTWAITLLLTAFFCLLYFAIKKLPGLMFP